MRVDERTIQNATDSDGGASATELLTLVAPGSKGGFLNNNLRGIAQLAQYIQQCAAAVKSRLYRWRSLKHLHQHHRPQRETRDGRFCQIYTQARALDEKHPECLTSFDFYTVSWAIYIGFTRDRKKKNITTGQNLPGYYIGDLSFPEPHQQFGRNEYSSFSSPPLSLYPFQKLIFLLFSLHAFLFLYCTLDYIHVKGEIFFLALFLTNSTSARIHNMQAALQETRRE